MATLLWILNGIAIPFKWFWFQTTPKLKAVIFGLIALGLLLMFGVPRCNNYLAERKKSQLHANINAGLKQAANITAQIEEQKGDVKVLEAQKQDVKNQIAQDTQDLANISQAREEDKVATNAALANFNAAMQTNSNKAVNVTARDLENIASRLP